MSRIETLHKYKDFINEDVEGKILLKQQRFWKQYVSDNYSSIDKMLLFHGIGTGKTCTSITIAETIMEKHPEMKTLVILPARLKSNFEDELLFSACNITNKYANREELEILKNPAIAKRTQHKIKKIIDDRIAEKYEIISFENLRLEIKKSKDIIKTIQNLTENKIIIIDEVHNLITSKIKPLALAKVIKEKQILKETPSLNGVIMRLLTKLAHPTSKFFLLTATPIYDNYGQFIELILNLCPDIDDTGIERSLDEIRVLLPKLKGKISYYKLDDVSAYPAIKIDNIQIPLSTIQENAIMGLKQPKKDEVDEFIEDDKSELKDTFCIKERQLSISVLDIKQIELIQTNLQEYAPKIAKLFELINTNEGKHLIYSNFIEHGINIISKLLEKNGWTNYLTNEGINEPYKSFIVWDSTLSNPQKTLIKSILNNPSNIDGNQIKIILGSPSIKEGISFKHIQHLHQLDPVWNSSAKEQIEGRCIRYKSHEDIPIDHPTLKREVIIHNYISVPKLLEPKKTDTCDLYIYSSIIENKFKIVKILEELFKKISIEYYLFGNQEKSKSSSIELSPVIEELSLIANKPVAKPDKKEKNTCPENRRPIDGKCNDEYPYMRKNRQKYDCCYKNNLSEKSQIPETTRETRSSARKKMEGGNKFKKILKLYL
jgi:hypothetical protein